MKFLDDAGPCGDGPQSPPAISNSIQQLHANNQQISNHLDTLQESSRQNHPQINILQRIKQNKVELLN